MERNFFKLGNIQLFIDEFTRQLDRCRRENSKIRRVSKAELSLLVTVAGGYHLGLDSSLKNMLEMMSVNEASFEEIFEYLPAYARSMTLKSLEHRAARDLLFQLISVPVTTSPKVRTPQELDGPGL